MRSSFLFTDAPRQRRSVILTANPSLPAIRSWLVRKRCSPELLTLQPKPRIRPIVFFAGCILVLGCASYFKPEPYRAFYGGLAAFFAFAIIVQYRRETILARNHLSAIALVTGYRVRGQGVPHFGKGVPRSNMSSSPSIRRRTMEKPAGAQPVCRKVRKYRYRTTRRIRPEIISLGGFVFYSLR
jgi:hypothetical protein